ncbi:MAG: hypothetical protein KA715_11800 [Xanthomonadaceae bacterium]|nr:hypothetical protein [Xanthomonadaceae bacterium]
MTKRRKLGTLAGALVFWYITQNTVMAGTAWFGVSPDNSRDFVIDVINSTRKELLINIYEFKHPAIRDAVINLINKNKSITVQILVEGQPYSTPGQTHSPMRPETRDALKAIQAAMDKSGNPKSTVFIMYAKDETKRRFVYDHAKYMVVDLARVYVSSENFSPSTMPKAESIGNRGWHVFIEDKALVKNIISMFKEDSNPKEADIVDLRTENFPPTPGTATPPKADRPRDQESFPRGKGTAVADDVITSPGSDKGLVELIESANHSVDIEFASLPSSWKVDGKFVNNPVFQALLDVAKKKVKVRLLLNDDEAWGPLPVLRRQNLRAACFAQRIASGYKLPLTAKIVDVNKVGITYIHNKGMIIDNERVLVSSINGTKNSMKNNRELGIVLDSPDAADYYGEVFDYDWAESGKLDFKICEEFRKKPDDDEEDGGGNAAFLTVPGDQYLAAIFQLNPL